MNEGSHTDFKALKQGVQATTKERRTDMGTTGLQRSVSLLADGGRRLVALSLRTVQHGKRPAKGIVACAALFLTSVSFGATTYTVNAYFTDPVLYKDFLANATNQYVGTVKAGIFSNTQTFTATAKKQTGPPPPPSDPIYDGTAFDRCFVHGYVFGMEDERREDLKLVNGIFNSVAITNTCGGYTNNQDTLDDAFINGCALAFGIMTSTITQRDGLPPPILVPPFPKPQ